VLKFQAVIGKIGEGAAGVGASMAVDIMKIETMPDMEVGRLSTGIYVHEVPVPVSFCSNAQQFRQGVIPNFECWFGTLLVCLAIERYANVIGSDEHR
jgi:hypothetical protein